MAEDIRNTLSSEAEASEQHRDQVPRGLQRARRQAHDPSQVYSIRVPVDMLEILRMVAARKEKAPSALIREWVVENLAREIEPNTPKPKTIIELAGNIDYSLEIRRRIRSATQGSTQLQRAQL